MSFGLLRLKKARLPALALPDPDLKWNEERGSWDFRAIDWEEFQQVLRGNGPCNEQRLATCDRLYLRPLYIYT